MCQGKWDGQTSREVDNGNLKEAQTYFPRNFLFMLRLLVNFFGGAAAFVLEVVGAAALLPALLVDPSLGDGSKSAETAAEMLGVVADGDDVDGAASEGTDAEVD